MEKKVQIDCPYCNGTGKAYTSDRRILLGQRIRALRGAKNITQEDLASAMEVTRTSITNIEAGRQNIPIHRLYQIADILQTDIKNLFS